MKSNFLAIIIAMHLILVAQLSAQVTFQGQARAPASEHALWYHTPADSSIIIRTGLVIGNSQVGGIVSGGVDEDRIYLSEKSLWHGSNTKGNGSRPGAGAYLQPLREAIIAGDHVLADQIFHTKWAGDHADFGSFSTLGILHLDFETLKGAAVSNYRRDLDLAQGVLRTSFSHDGADYVREYFCSYPAKIMAIRLTCSQPSRITVSAAFSTPQKPPHSTSAAGHTLTLEGSFAAMDYETSLKLLHDGGTLSSGPANVKVSGANSVTIILAAATSYVLEWPHYRGGKPKAIVAGRLANAGSDYEALKSSHISDYRDLYDRVKLNLAPVPAVPTDELLAAYTAANSQAMDELYFHYARYLLISCSRPGTLPANLNGMWSELTNPPWDGQYTCDINVQDTYWLAELGNLTECSIPLIDWITDLIPSGRITARNHYNVTGGGWVMHSQGNVWGFTGIKPWNWCGTQPSNGAWLAQNVWEKYAFTLDTAYLKSTLYPILKGAAQFWTEALMRDKDGTLVSCPGVSAEQGRIQWNIDCLSKGSAMDQALIWQLFSNVIKASEILDVDADFRRELCQKRDSLSLPQVGARGQIREWKDYEDHAGHDGHRHLSEHLGLYPLNMYTPTRFPELYAAAGVSTNLAIKAGGEIGQYGFTTGQLCNQFARLYDGRQAHGRYAYNLKSLTLPNLLGTTVRNKSIYLVENNTAMAAGLIEMLVQSHQDSIIHLLPALPDVWPSGSVSGLCARGGFEVSMMWTNKQLVPGTVVIKSKKGAICRIKNDFYLRNDFHILNSAGKPISYTWLNDVFEFPTQANTEYTIKGGTLKTHPAGVSNTQAQTLPNINLGGYNGMYVERVDSSYNAGISQYVSMLGRPQYAGYNSNSAASFQAGTWLTAQDTTANVYSTIEGGPGQGGAYGNFWNNNGFGMGVVGPKFRGVANGPIGGWGDGGQYAVAQLSPRLLFPPRSEMFRAGTAGQFAGYGYFALPLLPGKPTTDGVNVPTGDRWWTLFFNTRNFKGPVAAVVPYFWSKFTKDRPEWAGQLLDSRWTDPNPQYSNESHTVPGKEYDGPEGSYVRVQPLFFSLNNGANSTIALNSPTAYNQTALWNAANQWFNNNGPAPVGPFTSGAIKKKISGGKLGWTLWESPVRPNPKPRNMPMNFDFVTPTTPDQFTMGYQWGTNEVVELTQYADGTPAVKMPEYYQLVEGVWTPVPRRSLPPSVAAKLDSEKLEDTPPVIKAPEVWTRSDEPSDTPHWTIPGPATGPFQARLDNGMVVTYQWYRFRDQPALQYADLTEAELSKLQVVAEKIHQSWTINGSYLPEPTMGTLADVDPALLVTPPAGMEVGYVPIPSRQEWGGFVDFNWKQAASGNLSTAANWTSRVAPVDGGHSYYRLNFSPSGTYTVTNNLGSGYGHGGYKVNRLSFAGTVTLAGNPITLTTDYEALPQINQNSNSEVVISAPLKMYVSTVLGGTGSGTVHITSDIFGPWQGLTVKSPGTWRLSGNNTYNGVTSVEAGTLSCSQPASLGSGALKISNGAVVNLNYNGTRTISALTLGGTNMPPGVYGSPSSPATNKNSRFSGNGTVTVSALATGPSGTGSISRDVWTDVAGTAVSDIPLATSPNTSDTLTSFEGPSNWANNYGTRIRGYLTAPDTGSYTFWIASDENSKLWLSTDSTPTNKVKIAEVSSYTGSREWNKFASQKSVTINLIAGKQYYIEALHKEGSGNDHLAVGWSRPGESASSPSEVIPGAQLSPYVPSSLPVNSTLNPADNTTDVAVATNLVATFSENIAIGTGNITLKNRYAWCLQEIKLLGR